MDPFHSVGDRVSARPVHLSPLILAGCLVSALIFGCGCCVLFLYDLYHQFVLESPTVHTIVNAALQYSLDDLLARMFGDPAQWATMLAALWWIPTTLYALPTTASQRSRVLQAAGWVTCPEGDDEHKKSSQKYTISEQVVFQPGAWINLLPKFVQATVNDVIRKEKQNPDNAAVASVWKSLHDGTPPDMVNVSLIEPLFDDDDGENEYFPYSVSPIYNTTTISSKNMEPQRDKEEENESHSQKRTDDQTDIPVQSMEVELYQVFTTSVQTMMKEKFGGYLQDLQEQKFTFLALAMTSISLFCLQQRQSTTARSILNHILQVVGMAGTSTAAIVSILGMIIPRLLQPPSDSPPKNTSIEWEKTLGFAASIGLIRTAIPHSLTNVVTKRIPWKGIIAAIVLFYFRRRYLKNPHQRQSLPIPKSFS